MLLHVRIPNHTKEAVDRLVNARLYPDFNSAVVVALENLLVAEAEHVEEPVQKTAPPASAIPVISGAFEWKGAPELKKVRRTEVSPAAPGLAFPIERWLFGQRNRLLPLKVNARLLLLQCSGRSECALQEAVDKVSAAAAEVGSALAKIDAARTHKKEELLATGFPTLGSDKSTQRYADQFVTAENKKGEVNGMMTDWAMAVVERTSGRSFIVPTDACVTFASLSNPLLDGQEENRGAIKFSDEEIDWALRHVKLHVPVEAFTFRTILRGIETGANDPTKLDEYLHREKLVNSPQTSREFVGTQRAGAVSRMVDLSLLRRVRDGVRVSYELTDRASAFFDG